MKSIESKAKRVVFARLEEGDDLLDTIGSVAKEKNIISGFFFLIGTLKHAVLGFYKDGRYIPIEKAGPLEIVSCMGNISQKEGKTPKKITKLKVFSKKDNSDIVVHGHIVVSDDKGIAYGGHLLGKNLVDVTAELVLVDVEGGVLRRKLNPQNNLHLWSLGE